ncbi:hypothetical protein ACIGCZ_15145 [Streptomyces nigra]|uniref:hypothetical protein n=1 Tax=Streptomyces nigra TaxID=1827580 RepID=UPI0037CD4050
MTTWRVAVETRDPDAAGRPTPAAVVGHAYDMDAGEPAHPITQGTYRVHPDHAWSKAFLGWERCSECTGKVGRRA